MLVLSKCNQPIFTKINSNTGKKWKKVETINYSHNYEYLRRAQLKEYTKLPVEIDTGGFKHVVLRAESQKEKN